MRILRSLWVRVATGFVLVALVAVGLVAVLANRATTRQFEVYVSQGRQVRAERLAPLLAAYYEQAGSWAGVEAYLPELRTGTAGGQGQGRGRGSGSGNGAGPGVGNAGDRLVVADASGRVLADSAGILSGESLSSAELAMGAPIVSGGELVGTLLVPAESDTHPTLEAQFLDEVNHSLLWAGLVAAGVALVLGLLLARQLTAPLRALTDAARRLASRKPEAAPDETPQVEVTDGGEIGELARAFNEMADSLARQETLRRHLVADIAHELRTPLSVMRSDLEALLDGVYEATPENLASLHEETVLLARLVDDLRALSEAEAGQLSLKREPTDLGACLRGVVAGFQGAAEAHGRGIELSLPPALPPVDADPQRLRQVVANLLSNALRHAPDSGPVTVAAAAVDGAVEVSVADRGPGIPTEDLPHVFDRFWRGGSRARGSGLGLAIARELVRAHGGRIWVDSHPGAGTAFHFTLPAAGAARHEGYHG